jgi:hypothetical protein
MIGSSKTCLNKQLKLHDLLKEGIITQEEFELQKKKIFLKNTFGKLHLALDEVLNCISTNLRNLG